MDRLDYEQASILETVNPFCFDYTVGLTIGESSLMEGSTSFLYWDPEKTEEEQSRDCEPYLSRFELEKDDGWVIERNILTLPCGAETDFTNAILTISENGIAYGDNFTVNRPGQVFLFINPVTKTPHVLEVKNFETGVLSYDETQYGAGMEYVISPFLSEDCYKLRDIGPDRPENCPAFMFYDQPDDGVRREYAYLRKEPISFITWRMEFYRQGESFCIPLK